jgi:hypothetical protein
MNITLEIAMQVHEAGIEFMEAAKRVFPERNGARNPDGSFIGWNILNSTPSFTKLWISYSMDGQKMSVHKELSVFAGRHAGRNRLSAEPWLGGDNRLGRLNCGAGQLGFRASLQPRHSFLNRFAECASVLSLGLPSAALESRSRACP